MLIFQLQNINENEFNSHDTVRLSTTNYALSTFNESESKKLPQGPPLKFDSASFGGISQNRK